MLLALEAGLILHSALLVVYHVTLLEASSPYFYMYCLHCWWFHSSTVLALRQANFCPVNKTHTKKRTTNRCCIYFKHTFVENTFSVNLLHFSWNHNPIYLLLQNKTPCASCKKFHSLWHCLLSSIAFSFALVSCSSQFHVSSGQHSLEEIFQKILSV